MKKIFILTVSLLVCTLCINMIAPSANGDTALRTYKPINIAKGSFLKAINQRDISTSTVKVGDIQYFINPTDVYIGTSNVIPKNSVYLGKVEEVLEAVEGINASMKIRIYKVITPSEDEYSIDAYVYSKGKTSIGGELTPVAYYTRIPHYPGDWKKGTLQYVPTSIHEKGRPTVLRAGDEVTFIINNDMSLYTP